jgi:hypothetical protein
MRGRSGHNRLEAGPVSVPQNQVKCRPLAYWLRMILPENRFTLFPDHALAQLNKPGRRNDEQQARRRGGDEESLRDIHG